jgi:hypothetical protein
MLGHKKISLKGLGMKSSDAFTLGNKLTQKASKSISIPKTTEMHQELANNIGNSIHSQYMATGLNKYVGKQKKSNLEK